MKTYLREMAPSDIAVLLERLKEQNERDGTSYALPRVFDENGRRLASVPLALTAVDVETSQPVQGHIWLRTVEHMAIGIEPGATVSSIREQEAVWFLLRQRGYTDEHIFVPYTSATLMENGLAKMLGMIATGKVLKHFYRLLDPADNAELQDWYRKQEEKENVASPAGTGL